MTYVCHKKSARKVNNLLTMCDACRSEATLFLSGELPTRRVQFSEDTGAGAGATFARPAFYRSPQSEARQQPRPPATPPSHQPALAGPALGLKSPPYPSLDPGSGQKTPVHLQSPPGPGSDQASRMDIDGSESCV